MPSMLTQGRKIWIKFRLHPGACVRNPKALYLTFSVPFAAAVFSANQCIYASFGRIKRRESETGEKSEDGGEK